MTDPDALDDTADDHEQFKTELIAQDRDAAQISTADIDETTARQLVNKLVDDSVVTPIPKQRVLVHGPSDEAFEWGYGGSGPAQLALALLLDFTDDEEVALVHYTEFKNNPVRPS